MYLAIDESVKLNEQKIDVLHTAPNKVIFRAIVQTVDDVNRNGRIYPKKDMEEAVNNLKDRIQTKTFGGELDHPMVVGSQEEQWARHVTYAFSDASHCINEIYFEGNKIMAEIETLSTPKGYALAGLVGKDKVIVGFSVRAISDNVSQKDGNEVVSGPITIIAYDCVSFPSHSIAYLTKIIKTENYEQKMNCTDGICGLTEHMNKYHYNNGILLKEKAEIKVDKKLYDWYKSNNFRI